MLLIQPNVILFIIYKHIHRKNMLNHMKRCFFAMIRGEDVPSESQEKKKYAHEVQFTEATTESVLQLIFSCIILREFGLPLDPFQRYVQLSSLIGSIFAITFQFAKVFVLFLIMYFI